MGGGSVKDLVWTSNDLYHCNQARGGDLCFRQSDHFFCPIRDDSSAATPLTISLTSAQRQR